MPELRVALGHTGQKAQLLAQLQKEQLPQTLLFHGPQGIGKATFALEFAAFMLSAPPEQGGLLADVAPEDMQSDQRTRALIEAGSHPDLLIIEAEESGQLKQPVIKVDAVRSINDFLSKTASVANGWRIVLIDGAEAMNESAANALLKIAEEPPVNALIVLIAHHPGRLLATLLSRCQKVAFRKPPQKGFNAILQEVDTDISADSLQALYVIASGSPGRASQLHDAGAASLYFHLLAAFYPYPSKDADAILAMQQQVDKHKQSGGFLIWTELWLLFLTRLNLAAHDALIDEIRSDEPAMLERIAAKQPPEFWQELYEISLNLISRARSLHLDSKQVMHSLLSMAFNETNMMAL